MGEGRSRCRLIHSPRTPLRARGCTGGPPGGMPAHAGTPPPWRGARRGVLRVHSGEAEGGGRGSRSPGQEPAVWVSHPGRGDAVVGDPPRQEMMHRCGGVGGVRSALRVTHPRRPIASWGERYDGMTVSRRWRRRHPPLPTSRPRRPARRAACAGDAPRRRCAGLVRGLAPAAEPSASSRPARHWGL